MCRRLYGLSAEQQANQRKSLEDILKAADAIPNPPPERTIEDMLPVVRKLRDEKRMTWGQIKRWMYDNTEFNRSDTTWKSLYSPKP